VRTDDLVFRQGITQCDTLRDSDSDARLMPGGFVIPTQTLVISSADPHRLSTTCTQDQQTSVRQFFNFYEEPQVSVVKNRLEQCQFQFQFHK